MTFMFVAKWEIISRTGSLGSTRTVYHCTVYLQTRNNTTIPTFPFRQKREKIWWNVHKICRMLFTKLFWPKQKEIGISFWIMTSGLRIKRKSRKRKKKDERDRDRERLNSYQHNTVFPILHSAFKNMAVTTFAFFVTCQREIYCKRIRIQTMKYCTYCRVVIIPMGVHHISHMNLYTTKEQAY